MMRIAAVVALLVSATPVAAAAKHDPGPDPTPNCVSLVEWANELVPHMTRHQVISIWFDKPWSEGPIPEHEFDVQDFPDGPEYRIRYRPCNVNDLVFVYYQPNGDNPDTMYLTTYQNR